MAVLVVLLVVVSVVVVVLVAVVVVVVVVNIAPFRDSNTPISQGFFSNTNNFCIRGKDY